MPGALYVVNFAVRIVCLRFLSLRQTRRYGQDPSVEDTVPLIPLSSIPYIRSSQRNLDHAAPPMVLLGHLDSAGRPRQRNRRGLRDRS